MANTQISLNVYSKNGINVTPYAKTFNVVSIIGYVADQSTYLTGNTLLTYNEYGEGFESEEYTVLESVSAINALVLGTNLYAETDVNITAAELKTGNSSPVSVIATGGSGTVQALDINKCYFSYTYGTSAFTGNTGLVLQDASGNIVATAATAISGSSNKIVRFVPTAGSITTNSAVYLAVGTGDPTYTTATGTGKLHIAYSTVTL